MKIFAICDESATQSKDLGYLFYYEQNNQFYIELPSHADPFEIPLLLSSILSKGEYTVNSYWSKIWVQQRIFPSNRHNINQILKKNHINRYNEFELLMLNKGRCTQDTFYLEPRSEDDLPLEIQQRFERKLEDLIPLDDCKILLFFRDKTARKCSLEPYFLSHSKFQELLHNTELFRNVQMQTGGYGIYWSPSLTISDTELYTMGTKVSVSLSDFEDFVRQRVVSSAEAAQQMNCSRQYVDELQKKEQIHPIKQTGRITLYLKNELTKRKWK